MKKAIFLTCIFSTLLFFVGCSDSKRDSCDAGQYASGTACINVGVGYYADNQEQKTCSNAPTNGHYTSDVATSSDCPWDCDTNYLVNSAGTGCDSRANTSRLSCGTGEVAVGIYGRTGWWMDNLGVRCSSYTSGTLSTTVTNGASTGGTGGTSFTYDCPSGSVLVEVSGKNGTAGSGCSTTSTAYHQYNCMNISTKALSGLGTKYGESNSSGCPGQTAFDYSCASGRYAYAITVDADSTGTYVGFTLGVNCR